MPRHGRNLVAAGLFLVLMAAAAAAILVLVGGRSLWFEERTLLKVRFDQAANVKPGSPVRLAGQPVGRVLSVEPVKVRLPEPHQDRFRYQVEVRISLPKEYTLYDNARVVVVQSLVGQSAVVNIEEAGYGEPAGEVIQGDQASPFAAVADQIGIGDPERRNIQQILANLRELSDKLKTDLPEVVTKIKTVSANLEKVTGDAKESFPELRAKLTATATNLQDTSEKAKATVEKAEAVIDENRENIKAAIASTKSLTEKADRDGGELLTKAKAFVEKLDGKVDPIMANVKEGSEHLKVALADFRKVAADGKALVVASKGNISRATLNLRITSEHLKALSKEVRRAPWRLLAKPDKEEVESLNLYDSARAFATAATDLDNVADTLGTLLEAKQAGLEIDPEILQGMVERLEETFGNYREAETALWEEFERIQK